MSESHDHEHHAQPNIKFLDRYVEKSWATYGVLCGAHCFMFLLFIILMMAVGDSFFYMDTLVPLYNRKESFQKRGDAILSAVDIADYDFNTPQLQLPQSQSQPQRIPFFGLEFIYEAKSGADNCGSGNIWETLSLEEILDFEHYIEARPKYKDFCVREYDQHATNLEIQTTSVVANQSTIDANIQILRDYLAANENSFKCQPYHSALVPCRQPSPDCLNVDSNPPGVIDCKNNSDQCEPIDKVFVEKKVLGFGKLPIANLFNQSIPVQLFYSYTHKSFGGGTTAIPAIRSTFPFGLPLKGFDSTNDRLDDQLKEVGTFLWDTYSDYLAKKKFGNINYYWDGEGMTENYINQGLSETMTFVACSFLGVWVYMSIMTKSCFKSTMGMGQILLSFFFSLHSVSWYFSSDIFWHFQCSLYFYYLGHWS